MVTALSYERQHASGKKREPLTTALLLGNNLANSLRTSQRIFENRSLPPSMAVISASVSLSRMVGGYSRLYEPTGVGGRRLVREE